MLGLPESFGDIWEEVLRFNLGVHTADIECLAWLLLSVEIK